MKKSILTILLAIVMLFNLNSNDTTQVDSTNNAMTVEVKFENPQLDVLINDQRDKDWIDIFTESLNKNLLTNNQLNGTIVVLNDHLDNYMEIEQERKYESGMDYLIQKTGMNEQYIQKALNKYHNVTVFTYLILTILFIGLYISFWSEHNKYERDWRYSFLKIAGVILLLYFGYDVLHSWLLYLFATEYVHFEHLIQLIT